MEQTDEKFKTADAAVSESVAGVALAKAALVESTAQRAKAAADVQVAKARLRVAPSEPELEWARTEPRPPGIVQGDSGHRDRQRVEVLRKQRHSVDQGAPAEWEDFSDTDRVVRDSFQVNRPLRMPESGDIQGILKVLEHCPARLDPLNPRDVTLQGIMLVSV